MAMAFAPPIGTSRASYLAKTRQGKYPNGLSPVYREWFENLLAHVCSNEIPVIFLFRKCLGVLDDACRKSRIFHIFLHRQDDRRGVANVAKKSRRLHVGIANGIGEKIRNATDRCGNDGNSGRERFHECASHTLNDGRAYKNVG